MRTGIICIVTVFILVAACRNKKQDVLPPAKMQQVMWDMMRADEMATYYGTADSSKLRPAYRTTLYQEIFRIHGITKEQFGSTLEYYESRPDLFKPIFDSLQSSGARIQKQLDSINLRRDTLRKKIPIDSARKKLMRFHEIENMKTLRPA